MTNEQKKDLKDLHSTSCGNGVCSGYLLNKLGKLVPRSKIAYMSSSGDAKGSSTLGSDIDKLLRHFEQSEDTSYAVLWHVPCGEKDGKSKDGKSSKSTPGEGDTITKKLVSHSKRFDEAHPTMNDLTNDESMSHVAALAEEERKDRSIADDKNLFISVAWAYQGKTGTTYSSFGFLVLNLV